VWRTGTPVWRPNCRFDDPVSHKTRWRNIFVHRLPTEEVVLIYDDVTERQEAELAVRRSEERLGSVLDATEDYYWDLNFETGDVYVGPRFTQFFGVKGGPLAESIKAIEKLIHVDDLPEYRRALHDHLEGKTDRFISEHRMRTAEAEYVWVRSRGRVVRRAPDGRPLRMAGTNTDITVQRRTEEQLRLWATVFNASRESILITDSQRRIISANPAFSDITGYALEQALGRDPSFLSSGVHDRAFYQQMWAEIVATDHWAGEMRDRRRDGEIVPLWTAITAARDSRGKVQHYIAIASDLTEREAAQDRIRHLVSHDALTDLPNRMLFRDRLEIAIGNAKRRNVGVGVLFIDLDRFKNVNDSLGQQMGDALLKAVAVRLGESVLKEDTVSRQGGDEFLVLLSSVRGPEDAVNGAQKILTSFGRPFFLDKVEIHITPSIGIALFPEDGSDGDTLIRNADAAMYYAKERGRNNFQFFIAELNERARRRLSMETSLRGALSRSEFVLHYQPQVNSRTGDVVGVEALIRWKHDGILLRPIEFVGMAEETGLIVPIGEWVIREACRQQHEWLLAGMPEIPMAINLSAAQFHRKDAALRLRLVVEESCREPHKLEIELTETLLMQEAEYSVRMLHALKDAGVRLAIDDFGTGYSSLNYLRRFPVDRLKVDQSFVRDLPTDAADRAVTEAIITLAHSLGVGVIAEGVETVEEMDLLRERACEEFQGYYFAPPLSAVDFVTWWRARLGA
jgi:diguanylate cyclase (GGDEF)-like protein/PAS domain S-box-containing protein